MLLKRNQLQTIL